MNHQQARESTLKVVPVGRPSWQVSLRASVQRARKRLRTVFWGSALKDYAEYGPQALGRAA